MDSYKITYDVNKKGRKYICTRSVDRTPPPFLQGGYAITRHRVVKNEHDFEDIEEFFISLQEVLFKRVKKTKKPIKLEVIFQVSE